MGNFPVETLTVKTRAVEAGATFIWEKMARLEEGREITVWSLGPVVCVRILRNGESWGNMEPRTEVLNILQDTVLPVYRRCVCVWGGGWTKETTGRLLQITRRKWEPCRCEKPLDSDTIQCRPVPFITHVKGRGIGDSAKVVELSLGGWAGVERGDYGKVAWFFWSAKFEKVLTQLKGHAVLRSDKGMGFQSPGDEERTPVWWSRQRVLMHCAQKNYE